MVVYGNGFVVSLIEPPGWSAAPLEIDSDGTELSLAPPLPDVSEGCFVYRNRCRAPAPISIFVQRKPEKNSRTSESDAAAIPGVRFDELNVKHPRYQSVAKAVTLRDTCQPSGETVHEYVGYMDPGRAQAMTSTARC